MPVAYNLSFLPIWTFLNNQGAPLSNGKVYFWSAEDPNVPKLVYRDPAGTIPYENPVTLDDFGRTSLIYCADDSNYFVEVYDSLGRNGGNLITTFNNFNAPGGSGGGGTITVVEDFVNHIFDGQFQLSNYIPTTLPAATPVKISAGKYGFSNFFEKSNAAVTDTLSILPFALGQSDVEKTPQNYIRYKSTVVGAGGETYKRFVIKLGKVISFENEECSFSCAIKSSSSSTVQIQTRQFFGTGGSPSTTVDNTILNYPASAGWTTLSVTESVPSVAGKSLGTNNDDYFAIIINIPLNVVCEIDMTNWRWALGDVRSYEYETFQEVLEQMVDHMPVGHMYNLAYEIDTNYEMKGDYYGYMKADGRAISRTAYPELFAKMGTIWGAGDSSTTFNLPPTPGRSPMGSGTGAGLEARVTGLPLLGEETTALTAENNGPHRHGSENPATGFWGRYVSGTPTGLGGGGFNIGDFNHTDYSGTGTPHNTIHPVYVVCTMIKVL